MLACCSYAEYRCVNITYLISFFWGVAHHRRLLEFGLVFVPVQGGGHDQSTALGSLWQPIMPSNMCLRRSECEQASAMQLHTVD